MFGFVACECRYPPNGSPSGRNNQLERWRRLYFLCEWHVPKESLLQNFAEEASYSLAKIKTNLKESKTNRKGFIPNLHQERDIFLFDRLHYFVGLDYKIFDTFTATKA